MNTNNTELQSIVRVLIVDDDPAVAEMFNVLVSREGHTCSTTGTAMLALELLGKGKYDIAIIDINLPDMSGIDLLRRIRSLCNTDIIIITGASELYSYTAIIEQGAEDFIFKPVNSKEVVLRLNRIVRKRKLLSDLEDARADASRKLGLQKTVSGILSRFILASDLDDSICFALESIATMCGADGSYLFLETTPSEISCTHEWRATGLTKMRDKSLVLAKGNIGSWLYRFVGGEMVHISSRDEVVTNAKDVKLMFESRGIRSLVIFPVFTEKRFSGFIGASNITGDRGWEKDETSLFRMTAEIIGIGLEKRDAENRLKEAVAHAEQADKEKSAFVANISHELRTPMNGIVGFSDILLKEETSPEKREYVEAIRLSSIHLSFLLSDLIDLTKIETGYVQITRKAVSLKSVLSLVGTYAKMLLSQLKKDLKISIVRADDVGDCIYSDEVRLAQILNNLIGNAIKFTEQGSVECNVRLDGKGNVEFSVRDTGIGIPRDKHTMIFDAYKRLESGSGAKSEGTGLGLTIAKKLVDLMGGRIWVESSQTGNGGTTFCFTIPFEPAIGVEAQSEPSEPVRAPVHGKNILLVEDDKISTLLARKILEKNGYKVTAVHNGEEAISAYTARENEIDLILMDIHVPKINGLDATKKIREFENANERSRVPIVALTAQVMKGERERCLEYGCDDFIAKPVDYDNLIRVVDAHISDKD
jgi:signal transduction histidine kinase/DNA-binding response OmpR family regulator